MTKAFVKLIRFGRSVSLLNWGAINFSLETTLVIVAVLWACVHERALLAPLLGWIFVGVVVFAVILAGTATATRAVRDYVNAKQKVNQDRYF